MIVRAVLEVKWSGTIPSELGLLTGLSKSIDMRKRHAVPMLG